MAVRGASRPLGALISQGIVAGSSLVLQFIAFNQLGTAGLGTFGLLFSILVTVNSIQTGWLGDSLTVLDRFEPGFRRALLQSQLAIIVAVFAITTALASLIGSIDRTTALLFGAASVMWVVEETLRRLLIARREFWKLVVNDASFAVGSLGLIGFAIVSGNELTIETLVLALFAGAVVAIGVAVAQLPRIELSRGLLAESRLRELGSFAFWRAAQIGLRPGSQAVVKAIVFGAVSSSALGQLEAARLLLAPVLTVVNGVGVYLLPTYSGQARRKARFRPAVPLAMIAVASVAATYGVLVAFVGRPLLELFNSDESSISATALVAWSIYAVGFGAGAPAGSAMVAMARSREAFWIRCADTTVGVVAAAVLALGGWVDAVPAGLALGTAVGAALLVRALGRQGLPTTALSAPATGGGMPESAAPPTVLETDLITADIDEVTWVFEPAAAATPEAFTETSPTADTAQRADTPIAVASPGATLRDTHRSRRDAVQRRLMWLAPSIMIVATEYKLRRRDIDDALSGSVDPFIAIELLIYAVIGAWAVWRLAPTKPRLTPLLIAVWGYVLTTSVSAMYSTFPLLGMARAVQLVIIGAVIHLLAVDGTISTIRTFLHAWIVLISVSILIGLAYVAPTSNAQKGRFTWLSVHSVSAGSMLAISICVLFGLWLAAGSKPEGADPPVWSRNVYGALLVFQVIFLLMTRTRGSIGATFVALAVMAWIWSGNKMKPQLLLGSLMAAGAIVLTFGGPILAFLARGESAEKLSTFNRRTEIWTLAWESFLSRPLHGLGLSSAKGVFFDETGLGGAHNAIINVIIDAGLIGVTWWLFVIVGAIVMLNRQRRHGRVFPGRVGAARTARADHLIVLGIFVASLTNSVTTEGLGAAVNVSAIWWFLCISWLTILEREPDAQIVANKELDAVQV